MASKFRPRLGIHAGAVQQGLVSVEVHELLERQRVSDQVARHVFHHLLVLEWDPLAHVRREVGTSRTGSGPTGRTRRSTRRLRASNSPTSPQEVRCRLVGQLDEMEVGHPARAVMNSPLYSAPQWSTSETNSPSPRFRPGVPRYPARSTRPSNDNPSPAAPGRSKPTRAPSSDLPSGSTNWKSPDQPTFGGVARVDRFQTRGELRLPKEPAEGGAFLKLLPMLRRGPCAAIAERPDLYCRERSPRALLEREDPVSELGLA